MPRKVCSSFFEFLSENYFLQDSSCNDLFEVQDFSEDISPEKVSMQEEDLLSASKLYYTSIRKQKVLSKDEEDALSRRFIELKREMIDLIIRSQVLIHCVGKVLSDLSGKKGRFSSKHQRAWADFFAGHEKGGRKTALLLRQLKKIISEILTARKSSMDGTEEELKTMLTSLVPTTLFFERMVRYALIMKEKLTSQNIRKDSREDEILKIFSEKLSESKIIRNRIVEGHLRLVPYVIYMENKNLNSTVNCDFEDLIQEGNIALFHAVEKYDPNSGCRFTTYAAWWIRQAIQKYIHRNSTPVSLSMRACEVSVKLKEALKTQESFDLDEFAVKHRVKKKNLISLLQAHTKPVYLSTPLYTDDDEGKRTYDQVIPSEKKDPETLFLEKDFKEKLKKVIHSLPESRLSFILREKIGMNDDGAKTLEKLAKLYGISKERIRQIYTKAVAKIAEELNISSPSIEKIIREKRKREKLKKKRKKKKLLSRSQKEKTVR